MLTSLIAAVAGNSASLWIGQAEKLPEHKNMPLSNDTHVGSKSIYLYWKLSLQTSQVFVYALLEILIYAGCFSIEDGFFSKYFNT